MLPALSLRIPPQAHAQPLTPRRVDPLPRRIQPPLSPGVLHRLPRWPFLWQEAPRSAGAQLIEDGSEDEAQRVQTRTADRRLRAQERFAQRPFALREVAGRELRRGIHPPAYPTPLPA